MIVLGIDYGDARTGVAVSTPSESLASPVCVVNDHNSTRCCEKVAEIAREQHAELVVVGYPLNMDGSVGPRAELCMRFAEQLAELLNVPVKLWDERSTTVSAHNYLNVTNVRGKQRKNVVDVVAATIILESFLAARKNGNA